MTAPEGRKGGPRDTAATSAPLAVPTSQHKQEARDHPTEEETEQSVTEPSKVTQAGHPRPTPEAQQPSPPSTPRPRSGAPHLEPSLPVSQRGWAVGHVQQELRGGA